MLRGYKLGFQSMRNSVLSISNEGNSSPKLGIFDSRILSMIGIETHRGS